MTELEPPNFRDPTIACGIISGFPLREAYPVDAREQLERLFKEDYD